MNLNIKIKYRELCQKEHDIPIFSKDWWLDAVAGEGSWDVVLVERGKNIIAALPYVIKKKGFIHYISMPTLTQTAGVWIKYPEGQKYANKLSFEKEVFNEIIEMLPDVDAFSQNFHHSVTNWLPFYWKGYKQTTRYTYLLENIKNHQNIYLGFKGNVKSDIKKAEKLVKVFSNDSIEDLFFINKKTFDRQNIKIPYDISFLKRIDRECSNRNCRKIFFAIDENNRIHSAIYIIWDSQSAYYLIGGGDPELRNSGATSLLIWEAIKFASTVTDRFDFEGSMILPIERFFSAFGAIQMPYFQISKTNSPILKLRNGLKEVLK